MSAPSTLSNVVERMEFPRDFEELTQTVASAHVGETWLGNKIVTISAREGTIFLDDLAAAVCRAVDERVARNTSDYFTLINRAMNLYERSDAQEGVVGRLNRYVRGFFLRDENLFRSRLEIAKHLWLARGAEAETDVLVENLGSTLQDMGRLRSEIDWLGRRRGGA
jgi:hypothetical protein